jgi:hypothetical protein
VVVIQIVAEEVIPDVEINRRANRHHPGAIRATGVKNAFIKKQKKQKFFLFFLFFYERYSALPDIIMA